jgi:hypothetical protein
MADIGDVIELIADLPERNLRVGLQGAIVHCHTDEAYEVEFSDDDGETVDLVVLHPRQFIVVWRAETGQWVTNPSSVKFSQNGQNLKKYK